MNSEKDKTKIIGLSVLISVTTLVIVNVFLLSVYDTLMPSVMDPTDANTVPFFGFAMADTIPIFMFVMWIHYSSMIIGLVASFHSQIKSKFSDLTKPYLAYLAYLVFLFDVGMYLWKNW